MKRKLFIVLLMFGIFLSGFMNVDALTTSSEKTEDNIITSTRIPYGYHYTLLDYNQQLLMSSNKGYTHSTQGQVGGGMFIYHDSNNKLLFCAELGAPFAKGATSEREKIFRGSGPACGILKSMMNLDTSYTIGQYGSTSEYTDNRHSVITVEITPSDLKDYSNEASYIKIQRAIWKYQTYQGDCKNGDTVITSYKVKSQDLTNPTLTLPTSSMVTLSQDGKNYEAILDVTLKNKENLDGDINYTIDLPAKVERINNEKIKVIVPVESYQKDMKLNLTATGKYNDYKNDVYTPVVTVYYFGAVSNEYQTVDNAQDVATVSLEETKETVKADLKVQSLLTLTNDPIKVVISKKDVAKEGEVEGAKIAIYNYDETKGEKILEFTSKKEPFEYSFEPGVYALEETLAPASYKKLETTFVFEVKPDGTVTLLDTYSDKNIITKDNTITIYNEIVVVPDTGSNSNIKYILLGSILLVVGFGIIYFTIKRRIAQRI